MFKSCKSYLPILLLLLLAGCDDFDKNSSVIYLVGDSTMAEKKPDRRPETGWGEMLPTFFEDGILIENHAKNGRSTRSFVEEGSWKVVMDKLKKGDYVFIEFGHNDSKEGTERYASPADYKQNLIRMAQEVRAKGGHPVLLTPVMRRKFDENGTLVDTHGDYPTKMREAAKEQKLPLIDMHQKSAAVLTKYGEAASKSLFLQLEKGENPNYPDGVADNTHFSPMGAKLMAELVVEGIREMDLPIRKYLKKTSLDRPRT
ncbi:MAG: GntR family transcriptional regulator [Bacteroidetes bacterium]|nr:GntR family transcriptional regulator [Bacteroidota bacterium]